MKAGHAGTLDPQATGLLIVCLGKATKSVDHFQGLDKVYEGTLKLGEETASYDAATPVERTAEWKHLTNSDIERAASGFQGEIKQLPPMYSAIKRRGKKLYEVSEQASKWGCHINPKLSSGLSLSLSLSVCLCLSVCLLLEAYILMCFAFLNYTNHDGSGLGVTTESSLLGKVSRWRERPDQSGWMSSKFGGTKGKTLKQ